MKIRNRNETSPENPLGTHQSPKFNIFGELVVTKSPAISNMKYPPGWGDSLVGKTKTELNQTRKSDMLPHASYDLDGDGYVSQADFRISKIFDEDKDGKLNDFERENADKAIKDGIIDKVVIEKELNSNGYLHTSKFNRFYKTDGFETQAGKTFAELKEERMNEKKKTAKELLEKVGDVQHMVYVANRKQDWYVENPILKTKIELDKKHTVDHRKSLGLNPPDEIKPLSKIPSNSYVASPQISSLRELKTKRKQDMLDQLHSKLNYDHISREKRMLERELNNLFFIPEGYEYPTIRKIKETTRLQSNEHNIKVFSNDTIGVHGQELPKFAENKKEYWTQRTGYNPNPLYTSAALRMSQRNWARPGNLLDQEPVKKTGTLIRSNSEVKITEKPNNVYPFEVYVPVELEEPGENKNPKHKYKMSTVVNYFLHSAAKMGISLAPLGNTTDLPMTMEDREFTKTQGSIENSNNPSSPMLGKQSSMSLLSKKFASSTKIPKSPVRSNAFSKYNLK